MFLDHAFGKQLLRLVKQPTRESLSRCSVHRRTHLQLVPRCLQHPIAQSGAPVDCNVGPGQGRACGEHGEEVHGPSAKDREHSGKRVLPLHRCLKPQPLYIGGDFCAFYAMHSRRFHLQAECYVTFPLEFSLSVCEVTWPSIGGIILLEEGCRGGDGDDSNGSMLF